MTWKTFKEVALMYTAATVIGTGLLGAYDAVTSAREGIPLASIENRVMDEGGAFRKYACMHGRHIVYAGLYVLDTMAPLKK